MCSHSGTVSVSPPTYMYHNLIVRSHRQLLTGNFPTTCIPIWLPEQDLAVQSNTLSIVHITCFTDYGRLQVHKHSPGDVLARPGLAEKGIEGVVPATNGLVRGHLAVWLDTVLQTVELPAGIADLHSGLSNVDRDALTL